MLRRILPISVSVLDDREVEIRMMTGGMKDDGYDLDPAGCELDEYLVNPIQLWLHDPNHPIGSNDQIRVDNSGITSRVTFAPEGVSAKADEICGLVKSGVVRAVSIGFEVLEKRPVNPRDPRAGYKATRWRLFECSFVSVGLDAQALVTARAQGESDMDPNDGTAKPQDDPKPAPETGTGEPAAGDKPKSKRRRPGRARRIGGHLIPKIRGMYGVAQLAWLIDELAEAKWCAEFEAEIEGDGSQVPAMLGTALKTLGAALVAMSTEEVAELMAGDDTDPGELDVMGMDEGERERFGRAGPALRQFLLGKSHARLVTTAGRAGAALSAANAAKLGEAEDHHARALEHHTAAADAHTAMGGQLQAIDEAHARIQDAHDTMDAAGVDPAVMAAHRAIGAGLNTIADQVDAMGDQHGAQGDAHNGIKREIAAAGRCLNRMDGYKKPADAGGDGEGDGDGGRAADFVKRQREARLLAFAPAV